MVNSVNKKKYRALETIALSHPKKWLYFHCPKNFAWVVYQSIQDILTTTRYFDHNKQKITDKNKIPHILPENIEYIHAVYFTDNRLVALLEYSQTQNEVNHNNNNENEVNNENNSNEDEIANNDDARINNNILATGWILIDNKKLEKTIDSKAYLYDTVIDFMNMAPKTLKGLLDITKSKMRKMTEAEINAVDLPYEFVLKSESEMHDMLNEFFIQKNKPHLDLSHNFKVSSDVLESWNPDLSQQKILQVTLDTSYRINHFKWLNTEWAQNICRLNIINMTSVVDQNIHFIIHHLPNLKELYIHFCPQITIRTLMGLRNNTTLEVLCLDDPRMVCQPNNYSTLLKEEEWDNLRVYGIKKLFLNSTNCSLDVIDYIRKSFPALQSLIIDHEKYEYLKKNLVNGGYVTDQLIIASTNGKKLTVCRDFHIKNLLKHRYQEPFSDAFKKVMEQHYLEEVERREQEEEIPSGSQCCPHHNTTTTNNDNDDTDTTGNAKCCSDH